MVYAVSDVASGNLDGRLVYDLGREVTTAAVTVTGVAARLAGSGLKVAIAELGSSGVANHCHTKPLVALKEAVTGISYYCGGGHPSSILLHLARTHDLVLVYGDGRFGYRVAPAGAQRGCGTDQLGPSREVVSACCQAILQHARILLERRPVWGCVLIGGQSRRMGTPKHLLADAAGESWLAKSVARLARHTQGVVVAGRGEVSPALGSLPRLADPPGSVGPLAGILAALRWQPEACWLITACDLPACREEALSWLLAERGLGRWAVIPRNPATGKSEPLLALYEPQAGQWLENFLVTGNLRAARLATEGEAHTPLIPEALLQYWQNINTPAELSTYRRNREGGG